MSEHDLLRQIKTALEQRNQELDCLAVRLKDEETVQLAGAVESPDLREVALDTARRVAVGLAVTDQIHIVSLVPPEVAPPPSVSVPSPT